LFRLPEEIAGDSKPDERCQVLRAIAGAAHQLPAAVRQIDERWLILRPFDIRNISAGRSAQPKRRPGSGTGIIGAEAKQVRQPGGRVVFNIKGNDYRLIAALQYQAGVLVIRFFGSHAEYDRIDAETV
jgi:HigB_toxin, RelE-like toxic component of a toxin-antitoxin system